MKIFEYVTRTPVSQDFGPADPSQESTIIVADDRSEADRLFPEDRKRWLTCVHEAEIKPGIIFG